MRRATLSNDVSAGISRQCTSCYCLERRRCSAQDVTRRPSAATSASRDTRSACDWRGLSFWPTQNLTTACWDEFTDTQDSALLRRTRRLVSTGGVRVSLGDSANCVDEHSALQRDDDIETSTSSRATRLAANTLDVDERPTIARRAHDRRCTSYLFKPMPNYLLKSANRANSTISATDAVYGTWIIRANYDLSNHRSSIDSGNSELRRRGWHGRRDASDTHTTTAVARAIVSHLQY